MMDWKLTLAGFGLFGWGIFSILWWIIKLISCIIIATLISTRLGLTSYYWWCGSIILFSVLCKIVFAGNSSSSYEEMSEKYQKKVEEKEKEDYYMDF